jgi:hypothetical protein
MKKTGNRGNEIYLGTLGINTVKKHMDFKESDKKITHVTENVHVSSFIIRQGGHPTQTCNIINSSHTRPGK